MIRIRFFYILFLSAILYGCAVATPEPTPSATPEPVTCTDVDDPCLEVIFSEDGCTFQGPPQLPMGTIYIQFYNQRDERARMGLWKLVSERTIQRWLEYMGDEPSISHHENNWFEGMGTAKPAGSGKMYLRKENFIPGIYVLDCFVEDPYLLWFAGSFTVE